jgi:hypothetical protein
MGIPMISWKSVSTLLIICGLSGCTQALPAPVVSPDGSMVATPDTTKHVCITIQSQDGSLLYKWDTGASPYQGWMVEWKNQQTLYFSSGDVGGYTLEKQPDNTWRESTPGGLYSPNGKWKVQTSLDSRETKKLQIWFGIVTGPRSFDVRGTFQTDLVVLEPFDCARWDGNSRVIVKTTEGEIAWIKSNDDIWSREN